MSYSTDLAKLVADQLSRFVTLNSHQLAGQVANLDFWLDQVRHALAAIDGYGVRFVRLQMTEESHLSKPRRVPEPQLLRARQELVDAACRFLDRCLREGLIPEHIHTELVDELTGEPRPQRSGPRPRR